MSGGVLLAMLAGAVGTSVATLTDLLSDPVGFILETVLSALVSGMLKAAEIFVGGVQAAFEPLTAVPGVLGSAINAAVGPVASAILWAPRTLEQFAIDLADALGVWAPFVLIPLAVASGVALYIVGTWALNILSPRIATLIGE